MSLEKRIEHMVIDYYVRKDRRLAVELAYLYLCLSKSGVEKETAVAACIEGFYWLRVAGCNVSMDLIEPELKILQKELCRWLKVINKKPDCI